MNISTPIFRFATVRNPISKVKSDPKLEIQPQTATVNALVSVLASDLKQPEKIKSFNKHLNDFIKSKNFYKTKSELTEAAGKFLNPQPDKKASAAEIKNFYDNLYNNIVIRTSAKSTTNEVFKLLTDTIKSTHLRLNSETLTSEDFQKIKIVLPEGLIFSFSPPKSENIPVVDNSEENKILVNKINDLLKQKENIAVSKDEISKQIIIEQQKIQKQRNDLAAQNIEREKTGAQSRAFTPPKEISTAKFDELIVREAALDKSEKDINLQITALNKEAFQLFPHAEFVYVGERYVDISRCEPKPPIIEDDAILVYSDGCYLKFPFQIADLKVVEQKTVAYVPDEIIHINNTQSGEKQKKVTTRLKRVETYESLITEDEVTKETDIRSTETHVIGKAASEVQSEETSVNVNASASGTYGVVTASLDAGFSHTESAQNANSSSQSYAKEMVQKVVDRANHKVRSEKNVNTFEQFEERVTHIIDNSGEGPKCYVYRLLTKIISATLINYGKVLMLEMPVAHASNYYLSRIIKEATALDIPPDPRLLKRESPAPAIKEFYKNHPTFPYSFEVDKITPLNVSGLGRLVSYKIRTAAYRYTAFIYCRCSKGDRFNYS